MHYPGRLLALLALLAAGGCVKLDSYSCAQSSECQLGGVLGTCEVDGLCSFPDAGCPSGKKYGDLAGAQSGQCVGQVSDTTGESTSSPTGPATDPGDSTSTTFDPTTTTTLEPTTSMTSEVTATTSTTTTTSTDPTTTTEPDTSTGPGPVCGEVGEPCVDGACCGGCAVCDVDSVCKPAPAEQNPCGACSFCGFDGECALSPPGAPCPADCGDIVWKEVAAPPLTTCYAYDAMPTKGSCDGEGICLLPDPVVAKCPEPALPDATKLAECEVLCREEGHPCVPGGPANLVDLDAYCHLESPSPACTTTCSDDSTSLDPATCDQGVCVHMPPEECGPYVCDPKEMMCLTACMIDADCAQGGTCVGGKCA